MINLTNLFEQVVLLSLMGSVVALGILFVKKLLGQKLSATFHYYIWFLLIIRLFLPYQFNVPLNLLPVANEVNLWQNDTQSQEDITVGISAPISHTQSIGDDGINKIPTKESTNNVMKYIPFIWLLVVILLMTYYITANIYMIFKLRRMKECRKEEIIDILEEGKKTLGIHRNISVVYNTQTKSPMIGGYFHPRIVISPEVINELTKEEIKYVFLHELSHLKRKDMIVTVFRMIMQIIHWFNPIIWYCNFKMKQDCEMSCDAKVLTVLKNEEIGNYGLTIINMMNVISHFRWIPETMNFAAKYNKRRIIMITLYKKASVKWTIAALFTLTLLTGCSSIKGYSNQSDFVNSANVNQNAADRDEANSEADNIDTENTDTENTDTESTAANNNVSEGGNQDNNSGESTNQESDSTIPDTLSFDKMVNLLGLNKDEIVNILSEDPEIVDEGGLEFTQAGIRVWFANEKVSQVFTQRNDIDINGAKIGESIDKFKEAFGDPVSDQNGDMHFKYNNAYLSVIYDTTTNDTYAIYILAEDF